MAQAPTPAEGSDAATEAVKAIEKQVVEKQIIKDNVKIEKIEAKEHKDAKNEKLEKNEAKEHKDAKNEKSEKNELKEHKDVKHEKIEIKDTAKIERKEIVKIEVKELEKQIVETQNGNPVDPIEQRVATLEQNVTSIQHFISTGQRPDLSRGALSGEPGGAAKPKGTTT